MSSRPDTATSSLDASVAEKTIGLSEGKPEQEMIENEDVALLSALSAASATISHRDAEKNIFVVATKDDRDAPRNWPAWKRYAVVILASSLNNVVTIAVSSYSTGLGAMNLELGSTSEEGVAGLSTFIVGFAFAPLLLAPLSEFYGRRPVYLISWALFIIFTFPVAFGKNIATILVFRFLSGFAAATPLANTGGVVHDLFSVANSGTAVAIYALSSTDGPPFGNVVGGYISQQLGWRAVEFFILILSAVFFILIVFFLPETRETVLMMKKTKKLRETTGRPIFALHELDRQEPGRLWKVSLVRPFKFLFSEPITYLSALINGYTYGIIFLANEALPLIFGAGGHGFNIGATNLTYLSFVVGAVIGFSLQPLQNRYYHTRVAANGGRNDPEARWFLSLFGIFLLPIGLFITAFTSSPSLPFMAPIVGLTLFGISFYLIIAAILNYVVDSYGHYSASALAGVVCVRNIVGAIFPLFAEQMYVRLGNQNATVILACMGLFTIPIPFIFFFRGKSIRAASPYCAMHADDEDN